MGLWTGDGVGVGGIGVTVARSAGVEARIGVGGAISEGVGLAEGVG